MTARFHCLTVFGKRLQGFQRSLISFRLAASYPETARNVKGCLLDRYRIPRRGGSDKRSRLNQQGGRSRTQRPLKRGWLSGHKTSLGSNNNPKGFWELCPLVTVRDALLAGWPVGHTAFITSLHGGTLARGLLSAAVKKSVAVPPDDRSRRMTA